MSGVKALVKNAASEEQVREAEAQEKFQGDTEENDIRWVLSSVSGRRFVDRLLVSCGPLQNPVVSGDPHMTYMYIGRADVGRQLYAWIDAADPKAFDKMKAEARERKEKKT